jgi:hypothetical protein
MPFWYCFGRASSGSKIFNQPRNLPSGKISQSVTLFLAGQANHLEAPLEAPTFEQWGTVSLLSTVTEKLQKNVISDSWR